MTNQEYFHNMLPKEEFERIPYLPTMGQFVDWFTKEFADMPALSDTVNTIKLEPGTYYVMVSSNSSSSAPEEAYALMLER